jgi:Mce-associated membrane protein
MMAAGNTVGAQSAQSLAEQAEAEAAAAEAEAVAARERARALRGAQQAEAAEEAESESGPAETSETADAEGDGDTAETSETAGDESEATAKRRLPRLGWRGAAVAAAIVALCALLGASGYMFWTTRQVSKHRAQEAEFTAAARQGVVNLMSLDFTKGDQDLQRLIDSTTGGFRSDFEKSKNDFLSVMKDSKVVTTANVEATGVESMEADTAVVLVAAKSQVTNAASAQQQPRAWRLSVTMQRDNGQLKMSKVEFVL